MNLFSSFKTYVQECFTPRVQPENIPQEARLDYRDALQAWEDRQKNLQAALEKAMADVVSEYGPPWKRNEEPEMEFSFTSPSGITVRVERNLDYNGFDNPVRMAIQLPGEDEIFAMIPVNHPWLCDFRCAVMIPWCRSQTPGGGGFMPAVHLWCSTTPRYKPRPFQQPFLNTNTIAAISIF